MSHSIALPKNNITPISKSIIAILIFFEIITIFLAIKFSYFVLGALFSLVFLYLLVQNTELGLYVIILLHVFIIKSTEQLNIFEVFFGVVLITVLVSWFVRKKYSKQEDIIISRVDFWLSLFLLTCLASIIPAILYQFSILKWFRELVPFLILFTFFPIVDLIEKKHIYIIIGCLYLLGFYVAIDNLIFYKTAISQAEKFWQLTAFRQAVNEPILFTLLTLSVSLLIYLKKTLIRLFLFLAVGIFGIALFATFSRGYWVAAIISLFCILLLSSKKEQIKIISFILILSVLSVIFIEIFFGNVGKFILQAIGKRFATIEKTTKDVSFLNRIIESKAIIEYIKSNPIWGFGLGATYRFNSLIPREMPTWYIHNGYLFILFKLGIPGLISLLTFIFISIYNGYRCIRKEKDDFIRGIVIGFVACLIAMLPLTLSSPQFIQKNSLLIISLGTGIIEIIRRKSSLQ